MAKVAGRAKGAGGEKGKGGSGSGQSGTKEAGREHEVSATIPDTTVASCSRCPRDKCACPPSSIRRTRCFINWGVILLLVSNIFTFNFYNEVSRAHINRRPWRFSRPISRPALPYPLCPQNLLAAAASLLLVATLITMYSWGWAAPGTPGLSQAGVAMAQFWMFSCVSLALLVGGWGEKSYSERTVRWVCASGIQVFVIVLLVWGVSWHEGAEASRKKAEQKILRRD